MSTGATDSRITEKRNPRTRDIDLASPLEIVDLINAEDRLVADAVATQRTQVAHAIEAAEASFRKGGRLLYAGAGTSGRLGVLDAAECPPTFGSPPGMVRGVIAGGVAALTAAIEGAEDDPAAGAAAMDEQGVGPADFVVGIAASGTTPFVRGALIRARDMGARTAILSCTEPAPEIAMVADIAIVPIVGAEVVTGSTRMKAGTATKMVLNMITTGAMIRLGKTYGNLMVDLRATNRKLEDRSRRIVMTVCDVPLEEAASLLDRAGGRVKTAIVMNKLDLDREAAEAAIASAGGVIRLLLHNRTPPAAQND